MMFLTVVKFFYLVLVFDQYWDTQYHEDKIFGNLIADNMAAANIDSWEWLIFIFVTVPTLVIAMYLMYAMGIYSRDAWRIVFFTLGLLFFTYRLVYFLISHRAKTRKRE